MIEPQPKVDKAKQEEEFKQREKEEVEALRRVSYEAKEQDEKYKKKLLPRGTVRIAIEAGVKLGWEQWLYENGGNQTRTSFIGMKSFGTSAPAKDIFAFDGSTLLDSLMRSFKVSPSDEHGEIEEDNVTDGSLLTLFKLLLVASRLLCTKLLKGTSFCVMLDLIKILSRLDSSTR